jgi:hypothetical protein
MDEWDKSDDPRESEDFDHEFTAIGPFLLRMFGYIDDEKYFEATFDSKWESGSLEELKPSAIEQLRAACQEFLKRTNRE